MLVHAYQVLVFGTVQRYLKRNNNDSTIVKHVDFDAPTREGAQLVPDDKKQDELLLEDIWTLLRAGRLEEASELCRSGGQAWRAATLRPFGGIDMFPSQDALHKNGEYRTLQAIELESGVGKQWHLGKPDLPKGSDISGIGSWDWNMSGQQSTYHALYPRAWTVYDVFLDKLLLYDHKDRLTAREAMAHPYFRQVRAAENSRTRA